MVLTKINIVDDNKEPKQRTVLDIGCGPSISNIISASKWSQDIILADFLDSNRKEVERFWKVNISKMVLSLDIRNSFCRYFIKYIVT